MINIEGVNSEYILAIYNHYKRKKGSNPEKPFTFKKLKLSEDIIEQLDRIVTEFGKQILRLNLLKRISDHLSFFEFYSSKPKKIVNKCADACWDLYYSRTNDGKEPEKLNLNRDEFRAIILNSYHVKYYQRWSQKETDKKMKDAISQWFRDVKKNNEITVPK